MKSILIEGGAGIIQSILEQELAQQLVLYIRPCFFGGYRSMNQQLLHPIGLSDINIASVDGDVVMYGKFENYLKYPSFQQQQQEEEEEEKQNEQDKNINSNSNNDTDDNIIYSDVNNNYHSNNTKSIDGDNYSNNTVFNNMNTTNVTDNNDVDGNSTAISSGANLNHYSKRRLVKFINVLN